ncbi:unnamed protein product [Eruca vesicaria subsp. sativa]|uniref:Peroxidase n=1 Tax=Eruca vesicaria subsp. sativa TaxID=29727 RepID=A0ABC8KIW7_ERUVS|nr:unnamed protein product [Eruca vesicaria subsp. sativa]
MKFVGANKITFVTCFVLALSIYVALHGFNLHGVILSFTQDSLRNGSVSDQSDFVSKDQLYLAIDDDDEDVSRLRYDYYGVSCPFAEKIIGNAVNEIYKARPGIAPSLIRLLFHDCFIEGCDASVLLDADESQSSEKEAPPNLSLKALDVIASIKSELEGTCPGVVSCADILVMSTREALALAGGPSYTLKTGRKDSLFTFKDIAERELPSPRSTLSQILASFASRGFSAQETVTLLGAHSIGITHCTFFKDRLYNFSGTDNPDPELNPGFLQELKTKCPFSASASSPSPCPDTGFAPSLSASDYHGNYGLTSENDGVIDLSFNNEGGPLNFGTRYYRRLLQNKGVMYADQQLMASEETATWVRAYSSDPLLFRRDFIKAMVKLSSYHVLTGPLGQVRTNCSKVLA